MCIDADDVDDDVGIDDGCHTDGCGVSALGHGNGQLQSTNHNHCRRVTESSVSEH